MLYQPRHVTGQMIFDWLHKNGSGDKWTIMSATGLTFTQFRYGLGFLQDVLQTQNGRPLVWSPKVGVYSLTTSEGAWMEYLLAWRLKSVSTQLRRIEQTALAGGMLFGTRKKATKVAIAGITAARQMVDAIK